MLKGVIGLALFMGLYAAELYTPYGCWRGNDRYCSNCDIENNICRECWNSFIDSRRGICRPPALNITGCVKYDSFNTCGECDQGYYLSDKGSCRGLDPQSPCATGREAACWTCKNSLYVPNANGECDNATRCAKANCALCTAAGCQRCLDGFTNYLGECVSNRNYPAWQNCAASRFTNFCTSCRGGYYQDAKGLCLSGFGTTQEAGSIWGPHCWFCWSGLSS